MAFKHTPPQSWDGFTFLDGASWVDVATVIPKAGSDTLLVVAVDTVASLQATKSATDALVVVLADVSQAPIITGVTPKAGSDTRLVILGDTSTTPVVLTPKVASDTLLVSVFERRQLRGGNTEFLQTSDVLQPIIFASPTGSLLACTSDVCLCATNQ